MISRNFTYIALLLLLFLPGCNKSQQELLKWRITLENSDKHPYGTYLAYQSLKYYFPDAIVETLSRGFRYSNMDNKMKYNYKGRSLIILEGLYFNLTDKEWEELKDFMNNGNEVIIFCSRLDKKIEEELN